MERSGIAKLTNENYEAWKLEVEFLLIREGLWKYIVPGVKPEEAANRANAAELTAWDDGDQKARATIGLLLSRNQHGHIRGTKTAKEVWKNLEKQHEKKSLTAKVHLLKRICDLHFQDGDDIEDHLQAFENLFDKLANAGTKLDADLQVILVFRSLPSSFDALTTTLENRSEDQLTLALVKDKIVNEVQKRSGIVPADSAVLKVDGKMKSIVCHHCQKPGHKKRECRLWQKQNPGEFSRSEKSVGKEIRKVAKQPAKARKAESTDEDFVFTVSEAPVTKWIVDSGASSHMCANLEFFASVEDPRDDVPRFVTVADGKKAIVKGVGDCQVHCYGQNGEAKQIRLTGVLFVPDLDMNLVSVGKLVQKGAKVEFNENGCTIAKGARIAAVARRSNGLYHLRMVERVGAVNEHCNEKNCLHDWHRKLGHRDVKAVQELEQRQLATGIKIKQCGMVLPCETCIQGKMARLPFPKQSQKKTTAVMDLVHSDLCGPMRTVTPGGRRYFLTLIDDHSRYTTLYLLREKSETFERIQDFVLTMKTQFGRPPKVLRSDQGGEYRSSKLMAFLKHEGIQQQFTTAYTPQQNGVAERKNRSLVEMARCLLLEAGMHNRYWGEAINTANHLQNMLPTKPIDETPYEIWNGVKPDVSNLQVFGTSAYVFVPEIKRSKLESKAEKLTFVGYSMQHKAWRFINLKTNKVTISRDARFIPTMSDKVETAGEDEGMSFYPLSLFDQTRRDAEAVEELRQIGPVIENPEPAIMNPEPVMENLEPAIVNPHPAVENPEPASVNPESATVHADGEVSEDAEFHGFSDTSLYEDANDEESEAEAEEELEEAVAGRRQSTRITKGIPPQRYCPDGRLARHENDEPRTFKEAVESPEKASWKQAMLEELQSMEDNNVWELTTLPAGKKTIGCRWIFKKKTDENGKVIRHKARLVAQGFTQKYGVDYDEVFAPVVKQITFRTLFSVANQRKLLIKHADVKTAYLNGDLEDPVYMRLPPGITVDGNNVVCRLRKGLYGLKQAARIWNHKLDKTLVQMGFKPSKNDCCLYVRRSDGTIAYIAVYVDDFVIVCESEQEYENIIKQLNQNFKVTSLGDIKFFLGIQVTRYEDYVALNQRTYIQKLLTRFGLEEAKPSTIPLDPGHLHPKEEIPLPNNQQFSSLIGGLLYVAMCTRPDIAAAVSILGRKTSCPSQADWVEAKRILRYLKGTIDHELILGADSTQLEVFVDADWAGDTKDRKSTTGYLIRYAGGMIGWCSRKQDCVTLSSSEAEYVAITESCKELCWILRLFDDLGIHTQLPVIVNEDNQSAIKQLESNSSERRSKHVDTKYHYARQLKQQGIIRPQYLSTNQMLADMMTKPLQRIKQTLFRDGAKILPSRRSVGGAYLASDE